MHGNIFGSKSAAKIWNLSSLEIFTDAWIKKWSNIRTQLAQRLGNAFKPSYITLSYQYSDEFSGKKKYKYDSEY